MSPTLMNTFSRIIIVAVPSWALWAGIIANAAPQPPSGGAQTVFIVSMVLALVGGVWACWNMLPQHANRAWRRVATIALGVAAFAVILFVGHSFGMLLASTLAG